MNNFANTVIYGNGGVDSASLLALKSVSENTFTGKENSAVLTSGRYAVTMKNFSKVNVDASEAGASSTKAVLYDTVLNDLIEADGNSVVMKSGMNDLYSLLAFDQVTAKKDAYSGSDRYSKSNALTQIFAEGWDEILEDELNN